MKHHFSNSPPVKLPVFNVRPPAPVTASAPQTTVRLASTPIKMTTSAPSNVVTPSHSSASVAGGRGGATSVSAPVSGIKSYFTAIPRSASIAVPIVNTPSTNTQPTNPPSNITYAGITPIWLKNPVNHLIVNTIDAQTINTVDISGQSGTFELVTASTVEGQSGVFQDISGDSASFINLVVDGITYDSVQNWYKYPTLPVIPATGGVVKFVDASGNHELQAIDGNLYYDTELLAKASDIQDVADWALYPALQAVDMDGHALNNLLSVNGGTGQSLPFSSNGITAMTIGTTGVVVFDKAPQTTIAPAIADDLTNKSYVDTQVSTFYTHPAPYLDVSGLTISNVGGSLAVDGQIITTGAAGNAANWSNYPAISNVALAGYDVSGCGSFKAGGLLKTFTLGSGPVPMLSANVYATTVDIIGYAPTGNSVNLHGLNTIDIRSEDGDINIIAASNEINITSGDVNVTHTDLTSVMNLTSFGPATLSAGSALLLSGGADVSVTAVGAINCQAAGAASFVAGGAVSIAAGDYVEINTGETQFINTSSGQSLISVNNIQGNSHNGGDGTLSLTGHSVSGTLDMTNHNITNVNNLQVVSISSPVQITNIDLSGGASISSSTAGIATDLNITATTGSINLNSSYAIYPSAPAGMDMTNCDITNLANVNGVPYVPTAEWSTQKATSTVDVSGFDINNVGTITANTFAVPTTGGGLSAYAGCPSIESGDAVYLRPKGSVIVQDASSTPVPGSLNAGTLEATQFVTAPTIRVTGTTPMSLTNPTTNVMNVNLTAGGYGQVRMSGLNLYGGGGELVTFKQSPTRLAVTNGVTDQTIAYLSDLNVPLPAASFSSTANQTVTAADTPTLISHNTTDYNSGDFSLDASGNIVADVSGVYEIITSIQFNKSDAGTDIGYVWARINTTDVPNSSTEIALAGNNAAAVVTVPFILTLNAGDTVKFLMASADSTFQADAVAAQTTPYARPQNPSIITTIKKLISTTGSGVGGVGVGGPSTAVTITSDTFVVPALTANIAIPTQTLGPAGSGVAYGVVGHNLSFNGVITQSGVAMPRVYTWTDGSFWYLDANLSNCLSSAAETWTINIQKIN